ncbi:MAG: hypothetical protein AVDCRST_MAG75-2786 [uncultured Propionibacteriaceae bacterium]|uniref:Tryptophan-associated membrane protein n=1 Tax=uncultured Propionibacteriaceae bacterium TaxID=257457 RepID=A0A6J4PI72_9ACTN|nr:MAG: hypothetical protein AVDCRST_MAG75-2786 [uncultured Propionibacteriaceae bacterium]
MRSRRFVIGGLLGGGLLGIVASAQPWWRARGEGADVPFTGTESTAGLSQALVVVALAGTLLLLSLRTRGARALAVVLALTGCGIIATGVLRPQPGSGAVRTRLRETSLTDQYVLAATAWPYVYAAAGVIIVAAAVVTLLRAGRWPHRADRFQRAGAGTVETAGEPDASAWWQAMDAGVDPTLPQTSPRQVPGLGEAPDVHESDSRDTMGHQPHKDAHQNLGMRDE